MTASRATPPPVDDVNGQAFRSELLAGAPVTERRRHVAGVSTAVLEGGDGAPVVLLHGQGAWAGVWLPVLPALVEQHRVVVPDLPGLGASMIDDGQTGTDRVREWLAELIDSTCESPPTLVGLSLGGSIAARFAAETPAQAASLVLLGAGGVAGRVRPRLRVLTALLRQHARPSEANTARLLGQLSADIGRVQQRLGPRWTPLVRYLTHLARTPSVRQANRRLLAEIGLPAIPDRALTSIKAPVNLVWGTRDRVVPLRRAERASRRYGWPLQVIDDAGHLSVLDQPATVAAMILASAEEAP